MKVLNALVVQEDLCGARLARLPSCFWASSNLAGAPPLASLLLHHANFVTAAERQAPYV